AVHATDTDTDMERRRVPVREIRQRRVHLQLYDPAGGRWRKHPAAEPELHRRRAQPTELAGRRQEILLLPDDQLGDKHAGLAVCAARTAVHRPRLPATGRRPAEEFDLLRRT